MEKKTKKILKIGIDIDNVISDSYTQYLARYNQQYRTEIRLEEVIDFYYLDNLEQANGQRVVGYIDQLVYDEVFQANIPPYIPAQAVVKKWRKKGYSITYITSRPKEVKKATLRWLEKHGFWQDGDGLFLFDKNGGYESDITYKKDTAQKEQLDLFIEDSKEIALIMHIPVLLLDKPWNKGKLPKHVKRVKNWIDIEKFVAKFAGQKQISGPL